MSEADAYTPIAVAVLPDMVIFPPFLITAEDGLFIALLIPYATLEAAMPETSISMVAVSASVMFSPTIPDTFSADCIKEEIAILPL